MRSKAFAIFVLALVGMGLGDSAGRAIAGTDETYRTSCRGRDCVRFLCDEVGQDCFFLGYFDRSEESRKPRNEFGAAPETSAEAQPGYGSGNYGNSEPDYHYTNHFDPDNDYDEHLY
jgi:hypothetical protein